ncbi:DUF6152 family protein [Paracraurococcus ruber]|uniref:Uncharacterized protein n=1 Tax=Paracraurococcus ruber TaxID=77675 RepID=A0ABS1D3Z6_9PROT|nr:DUF6152 family protein [Paracraurococcus ruber]MBK1661484.1 hypothetical protein [Paracraurococcus ruber]TDG26861.1 hypothetical protein E2C05_24765 [Paracraurococcus ruber]
MTRRLTLAALLLAGPAFAHHGWSSFDRAKVLELEAPVLRSTYANPHGILALARDGAELTIELAPTSRMEARGLSAADIAPGRVVRVHAYEATNNPRLFRAEWIEIEGRRVELR